MTFNSPKQEIVHFLGDFEFSGIYQVRSYKINHFLDKLHSSLKTSFERGQNNGGHIECEWCDEDQRELITSKIEDHAKLAWYKIGKYQIHDPVKSEYLRDFLINYSGLYPDSDITNFTKDIDLKTLKFDSEKKGIEFLRGDQRVKIYIGEFLSEFIKDDLKEEFYKNCRWNEQQHETYNSYVQYKQEIYSEAQLNYVENVLHTQQNQEE